MIRSVLASGALLLAGIASAPAQEIAPGDATAGHKVVSRQCAACHGSNGIAKLPEAANLAGQDAGYLIRQLVAFRAGERKHEIMSAIASKLTDQQIADAAAWYAGIEIEVGKLPGS